MGGTNGLKQTVRAPARAASSTLGVNVFTAAGKTMVGERPKPFGEAFGKQWQQTERTPISMNANWRTSPVLVPYSRRTDSISKRRTKWQ